MIVQQGFKGKLQDYLSTESEIEIQMSIDGHDVYDFCCFGVDSSNKLSDDRYMVFYNRTSSPNGEIRYTQSSNSAKFNIMLNHIPAKINKLVFTASIDGNSTMGQIASHQISIRQNGKDAMQFSLSGSGFSHEKSIISIEIYKKDVWKVTFIENNFNGGIADLLAFYGGEEIKSVISQDPPVIPAPVPVCPTSSPIPPVAPLNSFPSTNCSPARKNISLQRSRVELHKGQKVNLNKTTGQSLGEILINLNWSQPSSFLSRLFSNAIDLDLGCLYELNDGKKGCIQALGRTFGDFNCAPFIQLDGDDRTGESLTGENLRINGNHISDIRRVLVYTYIYDGAANWKQADAVVIIKCPGSQEVIVHMDEYGSFNKLCAIAMLENIRNETFCIEKLIQFFNGQQTMDRFYGWGMDWKPGRK